MQCVYFVDIDECLGEHECNLAKSICINDIGSYHCQCKLGYTGDGINCTGKLYWTTYVIVNG